MQFARANRGSLRDRAGLPLAARLHADCDPFIAVAAQGDELTFSCKAFAWDSIGAMRTARALEEAAHAAVAKRFGVTSRPSQTNSAMQFEYVLQEHGKPDIRPALGDDRHTWPYELNLAGISLRGGQDNRDRLLPRASGEQRVRKRIGPLLRRDPAVASLLADHALLRCRYAHGWYPTKPRLKVAFGVWDGVTGLPVALADQNLMDIVRVLIDAVPLRRKTAVEFYDAERGVKRQ